MYQKKKVLVIDDDEDINKYLETKFKLNNYDIRCTDNTESFLKELVTFKPNLILVDLNLNGKNGFGYKIIETVRKKMGPELIIIIMSRRNNHEDIIKGLEDGANDYITKPLDEVILFSKIKLFLGQEINPEEELAFYSVPKGDNDFEFHVPLKVKRISETGMTLFSSALMAKETLIILEGALANIISPQGSVKFVVKDVTIDKRQNGFLIEIEFDPDEHSVVIRNVRKLLLKVAPMTEEDLHKL